MIDLYIIQSDVTGGIKIGRTSDIQTRIKSLQTGAAYPLKLILYVTGCGHLEKSLHETLRRYKTSGEWFLYEGLSELPSWLYEKLDLELVDNWWKK